MTLATVDDVSTERLRSSQDIRRVFSTRRSNGEPHVVAHAARNGLDHGRVAVVAGRKVGNAVSRNRAKRRIRAVLHDVGVPDGFDVVVTGKAASDTIPFADLSEEVSRVLAGSRKRADR